MHRIDTLSAATSLPAQKAAEGPQGFFEDGLDGTGKPSTKVSADWANAIQEEIVNVILTAGLSLNKSDNTQLGKALRALVPIYSGYTGDVRATFRNTADAGWLMMDDRTIGRTGSGATNRANDDTQALYTLLWTNVSNTYAPVAGGRGVSALADFTAGKVMTLPKALGRALACAGAGSGLTTRTLGQVLGSEAHVLSTSEIPSHNHSGTATNAGAHSHTATATSGGSHSHTGSTSQNGAHQHTVSGLQGTGSIYAIGTQSPGFPFGTGSTASAGDHTHTLNIDAAGAHTHTVTVDSSTNHQHTLSINNTGGGAEHNNMQPSLFVHFQVKL